jgi:hypothetical protein
MFAMNKNSEIPCSLCNKRDPKARSFSCNPEKCQQLSEWLFEHAEIGQAENKRVSALTIRYMV